MSGVQAMSAEPVSFYPEGGYECDFVNTPSDHLICHICFLVLRNPHLTSCCGQHFCYSCINKSYQRNKLCPLCQGTFTVFLAQNIIREVNALQVLCQNKATGCEWVGPLKYLDEHVSNCGFVSVLCTQGCGQYVQKRLLQKHLDLLCPMRKYDCDYCRTYISTYQDVKNNHWKTCEHFPIPCPNDCPKGSVPRGHLMEHLKKECKIKQQLAEMRSQNSQLVEKIRKLENEIAAKETRNEQKVEEMRQEILRLENEIATKDMRNHELESELQTQAIQIEQLARDLGEERRFLDMETIATNEEECSDKDQLNDLNAPEKKRRQDAQPKHHSSDSEVGSSPESVERHRRKTDGHEWRKSSQQITFNTDPTRRAKKQRNKLPIQQPDGTDSQEHDGATTQKVDILHDAHVHLEWTQCRNLPEVMFDGSAVVIGDFVYAGGGYCQRIGGQESMCTVFGYNYHHDTWFSLPITSRRQFTLVSYQNELVLVGGANLKSQCLKTLAVWDEKTRQWVEPYPPMYTERMQPSAVGHGQYIVVAGGKNKEVLDSAEVYDGNNKQWHLVAPLPAKTSCATSAVLDGCWYLIGGNGQGTAVYHTSLDSLIKEALQPKSSGSHTIWQSLPPTEYTLSAAAAFGNAILAIGGSKTVGSSNAVRAYFPGRKLWLPLENPLPCAFYSASAVTVPTGELLLIGGCTGTSRYNHVFKASFKH